MNLAEWLVRSARLYPERVALQAGDEAVASYAELGARAARLAGALREKMGIAPGERVALFFENRTEYLEILYGVWHAGAVVVPVNYKLHPREVAWILENSGAKAVFVAGKTGEGLRGALAEKEEAGAGEGPKIVDVDGPDHAALLEHAPLEKPVERSASDLAWLFYTSGTTGNPKGVMISNANIHAMTFTYFADVDEVRDEDAALYAAPMSHGAGLYNFMHVIKGARHVVPQSGAFDPAEILALGRSVGSISMFAAPTMVRRLVDEAKRQGFDGAGLKTIVYGGGPMYVADIEDAVATMGPRFVQIYGQGECPMTITALSRELVADRSHPRWRERLGSVGVAQSCVEVAIRGEDGRELGVGETGEITVRGTPVMPGYWKNAEATSASIRDGWLWTGDVGRIDADGFVTLSDRSKDVIISGGTNIYPREVEEVLLRHEAVAEVSVVGRPDPEWGEDVVAFVVREAGKACTQADLDAHCLDSMARFKRPKAYFFLDALPKNTYGKVLKTDLRRRLAARDETGI